MSHPLLELQRLGQSPWHDNIKRELITSGKLRRMIDDGDVTGLTSNPTIFEQAIAKSTDYDEDLVRHARSGKSAEEIVDELVCDDIRTACDLFAGVYRRTDAKDGFCSIEVAPKFARDTRATIAEAQRLWRKVDRPNLMVKIPATREGIPAIEESVAAGLNINITLIFSLERYDEVMDAYLRGLIRRVERGEPVDRSASVASFFVSRVDTMIDKMLDERIAKGEGDAERWKSLQGKAAIANAKLAYQAFRKKFATEAFGGVAARGARVQRPLWASTSTKNPAYPDVYYVEALVGPDTVDTLPPATIEAYKDHGRPEVRIEEDVDGAHRVLADLAAAGIDMDDVTRRLEEEGVASFAKSFDSLVATVEERRVKAAAAPVGEAASASASRSAATAGTKAARRPSTKRSAAKKRVQPKARPAAKKTARKAKPKRAPKRAAAKSRTRATAKPRTTSKARKRTVKARPARKPVAAKRKRASKRRPAKSRKRRRA